MTSKEESIYQIIAGLLLFSMIFCFVRCYYYKHIYNRAERVTPVVHDQKPDGVHGVKKFNNEEELV